MGRLGSKSRSARGGAARVGQSGVAMRQASVERYLIGVRPVLINVFIGDLVEFFAPDVCCHGPQHRARPSLPSRKPVPEQHRPMLSSARPCH
ncbi:hypothetical protein CRM91_16045 [Burkholderia ambifaria]|nr:hypothetical protein CRM91_16045 [Burkholderia ambifaria]